MLTGRCTAAEIPDSDDSSSSCSSSTQSSTAAAVAALQAVTSSEQVQQVLVTFEPLQQLPHQLCAMPQATGRWEATLEG